MNIYNAKNNSMPEQVLENKKNIELLNTGKQDTLIAGENIILKICYIGNLAVILIMTMKTVPFY